MNKRMIQANEWMLQNKQIVSVEFWSGEVAEVTLLSYPTDAKQTIAKAVRGYKGIYSNEPVSEKEMQLLFQDLKNTKLGTPTEMLNFVFLIKDVPRSWTHQAVRTRIGAAVVQESTRFLGKRNMYKVLAPASVVKNNKVDPLYVNATAEAINGYINLVQFEKIPSQDARQLLPHSLLTNLYWSLNLRALMGIYNVRWCCQAEPSTWLPVMKQMKQQIENSCGKEIANFLSSPFTRGEPDCGFNASFDRPCSWRRK